ncbi:TATA box-binding protein-associated factor RNA polymerase I subunit A-like isoform X2 [Dreissena polymorpha]|uniref:TATA box-binding protein-associated factor RNA polymerase I subunit A-like isoform X2 n=1 Tax=Dreissena polymorpha TaxID=45954 RepID=UPI0022653393|nr:TATA box-binding protein-associated factor RNA polymerase I subunit A-like isoform X2 [Dreissena polymorpha]
MCMFMQCSFLIECCELLMRIQGPTTEWFLDMEKELTEIDHLVPEESKLEQWTPKPIARALQQLFGHLRQTLLSHRWEEAVKILHKIAQTPLGTSNTVWKVGSELLAMDGHQDRDLLQRLYGTAKQLSGMNQEFVALEFAVYLLSIGEKAEAVTVLQKDISYRGKKFEMGKGDRQIRKAYLGLVLHSEWRRCRQLLEKHKRGELTDEVSQDVASQLRTYEMQCERYAEKALKCFEGIDLLPGTWNIFLWKYVELLVENDSLDVAENHLQTYCQSHPDCLSSQKCLYNFLRDHREDSDKLVTCLKKIAELSPTDQLVVELCSFLKPEEKVSYLFNMLDYEVCKLEASPWKQLADCINELLKSDGTSRAALAECWSPRKQWWPPYHFTAYMAAQGKEVPGLTLAKALCASSLIDPECTFVTECRKYLSDRPEIIRTSLD